MLPFKRILCPTDFSQPSFEALKAAQELALHFSAELYLVHAVAPVPRVSVTEAPEVHGNPHDLNVPLHMEKLEEAAQDRLKKVAAERLSKDLHVQQIVVHGRAAEEIVKVAQEEKVDLIVLATHGETGWGQFFFGSVAEKVVRTAGYPVLVIRAPREKGSGRK
jgi:nucleotide-binding universal stress UspA family protein